MKKNSEIREYNSSDEAKFKSFYITLENSKKRTRVLHALQQRTSTKRTWQAGIVGIIGIHLSQYIKSRLIPLPSVLVELLLWSAGIGFVWYKWICQEYEIKLQKSSERIAKELANIKQYEKSNSWVLITNEQLLGTVALKYENGEGKIGYLTGEDSGNRLKLVQNAIQFGRTNKIEVISKWGHEDSKWSESSL